jgi:hypothetical protein
MLTGKNDGITDLALELAAGATSCTVDSADAIVPAEGFPFRMRIWNWASYRQPADDPASEIVEVTNAAGNVLTITRAQEGTADVLHAAGSRCALVITWGYVSEIQTALAGKASTGAVGSSGLTMATAKVLGRATADTGAIEELSAADARTLLNVEDGANAYTHPNHSGDVTSVADGAQTIAPGAVSLAKMADLAANSILGNNTGSAATPLALTAAQTKTLLGNVYIGTTAVALDRASAGLTLAGLTLTTPNLGTPSAGTLTNCTGLPIGTGVSGLASGVATFLATPTDANLAAIFADEDDITGSGALVFATSPTLVTPTLGVATATSLNAGSPATPSSGYIYAKMFGAYVSGGYGQLKVGSWNNTPGSGSAFTMFRARGTYPTAPTYCDSGDTIALWYFSSLNTTGAEQAGAALQVYLAGAPGSDYIPMGFNFLTYAGSGDYNARLHISPGGNVVCGRQAALATNATDGFLYVPTCAGTPSGTPTSYTGKCALVFDTSNNKLYVYDGGWIQVALAA